MTVTAEYVIEVASIEAGQWYRVLADAIIIRSDQLCEGCRDQGSAGAPDIEAWCDGQKVLTVNFSDLVTITIIPQERKHRV